MTPRAYYAAIAPIIFPHLRDRPVMLKRWPAGRFRDPVYDRDKPAGLPAWIKTVDAPRRLRGEPHHTILFDHVRVLRALVERYGDLELHPYMHRFPRVTKPSHVVFDLDPGLQTSILTCARVALGIKAALHTMQLQSFVKTSGSKGLHLYVPIGYGLTYDHVRLFARPLASLLAGAMPAQIVAVLPRRLRTGKVFIDWSANGERRTIAAPYTWRHTSGRPAVSMPVTWGEIQAALASRNPDLLHFTPERALERVAAIGDLWAGLARGTVPQRVPQLRAA